MTTQNIDVAQLEFIIGDRVLLKSLLEAVSSVAVAHISKVAPLLFIFIFCLVMLHGNVTCFFWSAEIVFD